MNHHKRKSTDNCVNCKSIFGVKIYLHISPQIILCNKCADLPFSKLKNVKKLKASTHSCEGIKNFKNDDSSPQLCVG